MSRVRRTGEPDAEIVGTAPASATPGRRRWPAPGRRPSSIDPTRNAAAGPPWRTTQSSMSSAARIPASPPSLIAGLLPCYEPSSHARTLGTCSSWRWSLKSAVDQRPADPRKRVGSVEAASGIPRWQRRADRTRRRSPPPAPRGSARMFAWIQSLIVSSSSSRRPHDRHGGRGLGLAAGPPRGARSCDCAIPGGGRPCPQTPVRHRAGIRVAIPGPTSAARSRQNCWWRGSPRVAPDFVPTGFFLGLGAERSVFWGSPTCRPASGRHKIESATKSHRRSVGAGRPGTLSVTDRPSAEGELPSSVSALRPSTRPGCAAPNTGRLLDAARRIVEVGPQHGADRTSGRTASAGRPPP